MPLSVVTRRRVVMRCPSALGDGLHDVERGSLARRLIQVCAADELLSVDEDDHVLAEGALLVEPVAADERGLGETGVERFAHRGGGHGAGKGPRGPAMGGAPSSASPC
jgi:hypothetical protein